MNTVGNIYQNVGANSGFGQTNFSANPAAVIRREQSVFAKSPQKSTSTGDVVGYGLFALLSTTVLAKNEKAMAFVKKITDKKYISETMEKLKAQNSNLVSLYNNITTKLHIKAKAVCAYKMNHNLIFKIKED